MLRVLDTANEGIDAAVAETGVDDDGTYLAACRLQQILATIFQVKQHLHRGQVIGVLLKVQELTQLKMLRESYIIVYLGNHNF